MSGYLIATSSLSGDAEIVVPAVEGRIYTPVSIVFSYNGVINSMGRLTVKSGSTVIWDSFVDSGSFQEVIPKQTETAEGESMTVTLGGMLGLTAKLMLLHSFSDV